MPTADEAFVHRTPEQVAAGVCPHGVIHFSVCAHCTPPESRVRSEPPRERTRPGRSRSEAARAGWVGRTRRDRRMRDADR